jgi:uncharacterized OB-fold protein
MTTYLKPLPIVTEPFRPFWDGLRNRQLLIPKCEDCGDYNWTPYPACRTCMSTRQAWTPVSGRGTVYSYSAVYRGLKSFEVPHSFALVELEEKPRTLTILTNIIDIEPEDVRIGMPVEVRFFDVPGHDVTLYKFAPVNS